LEFDAVAMVAPKDNPAEESDRSNMSKLIYAALTRATVGALLVRLG